MARGYIEGYNHEGMGVLRLDGQAVFVEGALDGEEAAVRLTGWKKGGARWGELVEILQASPYRREPPCPHDRSCGGCQLAHASYAHQLEIKMSILERALRPLQRRLGESMAAVSPVLPAPEAYAYRNKGVFAIGQSLQTASPGGGGRRSVSIGFYGRGGGGIARGGWPSPFCSRGHAPP
ncbi:MAG: hypothetical protein FWG28_08445, partial [Clostridiales bacterium]|nr:hypothetical protein [Clostridiales bacterium]